MAPFANLIEDAVGENLQRRVAQPKVIPLASSASGAPGRRKELW